MLSFDRAEHHCFQLAIRLPLLICGYLAPDHAIPHLIVNQFFMQERLEPLCSAASQFEQYGPQPYPGITGRGTCTESSRSTNPHDQRGADTVSPARGPLPMLLLLISASRQPQLSRDPFHRLNAERDVLFQIDAQIGSAVDDVIAIHAAGKGFVLHFFAHGFGFDFGQ